MELGKGILVASPPMSGVLEARYKNKPISTLGERDQANQFQGESYQSSEEARPSPKGYMSRHLLGPLIGLRPEVKRRLGIHALRAVPSTTHGMMKFLTRVEVATIMSETARPLEKPDVASASRSSPKNRKCQGCNTPGIPKAIRHY
ncbi:hypothetical protein Tco_1311830 [Tanacetum coccineum]